MSDITISVTLPETVLTAAGVRREDLNGLAREAIATDLYRRGRISLGKAAEVAGVSTKWDMIRVLTAHDVYLDYSAEDAAQDAELLLTQLNP